MAPNRATSHMMQSIQEWILSKICERQSLKKVTVFLSFTWSILYTFTNICLWATVPDSAW